MIIGKDTPCVQGPSGKTSKKRSLFTEPCGERALCDILAVSLQAGSNGKEKSHVRSGQEESLVTSY